MSRRRELIMFTALVVSGCILGPAVGEPNTLTVANVLKGLSLDGSKMSYEDEPPGKLQALECTATLRDTKVKVRVRIEVVYTRALFSADREWDPKAVRAAEVRWVTISPIKRKR